MIARLFAWLGVVAGLGMALWANWQSAPAATVEGRLYAIAPVAALAICLVVLHGRAPAARTRLAVMAVAGVAMATSYLHQVDLGHSFDVEPGWLVWLWPIVTDGLLAACLDLLLSGGHEPAVAKPSRNPRAVAKPAAPAKAVATAATPAPAAPPAAPRPAVANQTGQRAEAKAMAIELVAADPDLGATEVMKRLADAGHEIPRKTVSNWIRSTAA